MKVYTSVATKATDTVRVAHRADLNRSYLVTGEASWYNDGLAIVGTREERIDFLERLAAAAGQAATELALQAEQVTP
jgi:hypothetical protein